MIENLPILSLLIWAPILGGIWVLYAGDLQEATVKYFSLAVSILVFALSLFLLDGFDVNTPDMQFVEQTVWIESFNAGDIFLAGCNPVLFFLGSDVDPHVPDHLRLGRRPQGLRHYQIFPVYLPGFGVHAGCAVVSVLAVGQFQYPGS